MERNFSPFALGEIATTDFCFRKKCVGISAATKTLVICSALGDDIAQLYRDCNGPLQGSI